MSHLRLALTALWLGAGCGTSVTTWYSQCELDVQLDATEADAGATLRASGGPMSTLADTVVKVDGSVTALDAVDREGCDACDTCRSEEGCVACRPDCCTDACATCAESLAFTVPATASGAVEVVVTNRFGQSAGLPLAVQGAPADTGADTGDTDPVDTSPVDTSPVDSGPTDTSGDTSADTAAADTSGADTANPPSSSR